MGCDYYTWWRIVIELNPEAVEKYKLTFRNRAYTVTDSCVIVKDGMSKQWGDSKYFHSYEYVFYEAPRHTSVTNDISKHFCEGIEDIINSYFYVKDEGWNGKMNEWGCMDFSDSYDHLSICDCLICCLDKNSIEQHIEKSNIDFKDIKRVMGKESFSHMRN